jgi:P4 family phage/plasmid primase-like protien
MKRGGRQKAHFEMMDDVTKVVDSALAGNPFTEDALALRFSERHANDLRYIATKAHWLKWDGARWYEEATHLAFDLARQSCRDDAKTYGNGKTPPHVYSASTIAARFCGYCCTGVTTEHKFAFAYGTGANGKSTFTNTISAILGDYATIADVGTFIAAAHERHPTDVAKLHGYRLVVSQETEKGRRWDETKIKTMTGGDRMTARFMRCDFFDFTPKFKLWVVGNHKPRLDNVDEAMRRRMLLVPFLVKIPVEERDRDLMKKLEAERPAILRWMLDGCLEWQQVGLAPPAIVTEATDAYFDDQDLIKQWLEECTQDGGPVAFTSSSQLFASWKTWCDARGLPPLTAI